MPIVFISIIYCKNCLLQFVEAEGMHAGHKSCSALPNLEFLLSNPKTESLHTIRMEIWPFGAQIFISKQQTITLGIVTILQYLI